MINKEKLIVVYDIETIAGCFTYTAINIRDGTKYQYVLHKDRFELKELISHLEECNGQIGFNNLNFDYPVIHYILEKYYRAWKIELEYSLLYIEDVIDLIYKKAQYIIEEQNKENSLSILIPNKKIKIHQLDLFRIWHFNNKARKCIAA